MTTTELSLIDELDRVDGKAEIIDGAVVLLPLSGSMPTFAAGEIFVSLHGYVRSTGLGRACTDGSDFLVQLLRRQSFRPDVSFYDGPDPGMKFFPHAPVFAVEVRSEHDYGPVAERELAAKRADYFAAGTLVVWDVDLLSAGVVRIYRDNEPNVPAVICRRGQTADAEPAVPGWAILIDTLFQR